jgi:putative acetyltransferase
MSSIVDLRFYNGRQQDDPVRRIDDVMADAAAVYRGAVAATGPDYYDPEQVATWAGAADAPTELGRMMAGGLSVLRYVGGRPAALGQIGDAGHLGLLYVHGAVARQGHGGALLAVLVDHARSRGAREVTVDASWFSARLLAKHGFAVVYEELAEFGGLRFRRWRMRRDLVGSRAEPADET